MTLLKLSGASVRYPDGHEALRSADLHVHAGEFVALLGASGAGKSTLLRCLNGLVPLAQGTLSKADLGRIRGERRLRALRRHTGMVFQSHHLIGRLSALANVLIGRLGHQRPLRALLPPAPREKRIALEALDRVGLLDFALRRADQLSGGQQQRVGIARALAQRPTLILADEPVASLDPSTAEHVLALIHGICKADGIAAVVSLHQVHLARRFADRLVGLAAGRLVFNGTPQGLDEAALQTIYGEGVAAGRTRSSPSFEPAGARVALAA
jgi:phosphonate transport system ATP-binding protein